MMGTAIMQAGLPALMTVVGGALSKLDHPLARGAAQALEQVQGAIAQGDINAQDMAKIDAEIEKTAYEQINQSFRAEVASGDAYVRRMRPTFGYLMAITWAAQMLGVAYVIVFDTDKAGVVMAALANLSAIWAVGLSVLGIYVYKRSDEKMGKAPKEVIFWNPKG